MFLEYGESSMHHSLRGKANEIIALLNEIPVVKGCSIYGSLATNSHDELSDIDIKIDVSGYDNGQFMLEIVELLKNKLTIYYSDYAPSLIPDRYIVSIAVDQENPFLIVDLCCCAEPHYTTITKQHVSGKNEKYTHTLKLWTANLKHYARGNECYNDIVKMARKIAVEDIDNKDEIGLLDETLCWLEDNVESELHEFVKSCRRKFAELINRL